MALMFFPRIEKLFVGADDELAMMIIVSTDKVRTGQKVRQSTAETTREARMKSRDFPGGAKRRLRRSLSPCPES